MTEILGWHFTAGDVTAYDARPIVVGETLRVSGKIIPCERGLHASPTALDALKYAPGPILWRVRLSGEIVPHGDPLDKWAASERTALARIDATAILRQFARECASDVLHLWDAPRVVRDYLATGDENLRVAAAWAAARAKQRERLEAMCLAAIEGQ